MNQEKHIERKEKVLNLVEKAIEYCESYQYQDEKVAFEELKQQTIDNIFSIVVVGEFSAGKSTFLNALMGKRYLTSFTSETTATINFLEGNKSEEEEQVTIYYNDEKKEPLRIKATRENIKKYTAVNDEIDVAESIKKVVLSLESKFLKDGVRLVDSPGLNGIAEGHREMTEAQIDQSHACIFLFSAEQPGRKSDFEFLHELKQRVNRIFLVLNKIDVIKEEEQTIQEVVDKLKQNYKQIFPNEKLPEIFPIAAYPALVAREPQEEMDYDGKKQHSFEEKNIFLEKSKLEIFEERLWRFLTEGEKTKESLLEPVNRIFAKMGSIKNELEEQQIFLNNEKGMEEVKEQISQIEEEIYQLQDKIDNQSDEIENQLEIHIEDLKESIGGELEKISQRYYEEIRYCENIEDYVKILDTIDSKVNKDINKIVKKEHKKYISDLQTTIKKSYQRYYKDLQNAIEGQSIAIKFNGIEKQEFEMTFDFDKRDKEIAEMQKKIRELNDDIDTAENSMFAARRIKREKEKLEEELKAAIDAQESGIMDLGIRPIEKKSTENYKQEVRRTGLAKWLKGEIKMVNRCREVDNKEEIEAYKEARKRIEDRYENEIRDTKLKLGKLDNNYSEEYKYEMRKKQLARKQDEMKGDLEELKEKYKEEFDRSRDKMMRQMKITINDVINGIEDEIMDSIYEEITKNKKGVMKAINDVVAQKVGADLQKKKQQCEKLKKDQEASIEDKANKLEQIKKEEEKLEQLLIEIINVREDLEAIEVDKIIYS